MRLVGDYEARRFHVELSTAELGGGGTIAGRVHRDRELAAGPIVVRARCMEAWREAPPRVPIVPATRSMQLPRWHERTLWSSELVLDGLADAHWAAFEFALPARSAARRRGALGRLALRDRGAAPTAAAARRARDRGAARLPRDAARPGLADAAAARVRAGVHPTAAAGWTRAAEAYERGRAGYPAAAVEAILARDRRGARAHAARARRRHGQAHTGAHGQRRPRDRARARGRDARAAGARPHRPPSRSTRSPRTFRCRRERRRRDRRAGVPLVRPAGGGGRGGARPAAGRRGRPDLEPARRARGLGARALAHPRRAAATCRATAGPWRGAFDGSPAFTPLALRTWPHSGAAGREVILARVASVSFVAALDEEPRAHLLAQVAHLLETHPETRGRADVAAALRDRAVHARGDASKRRAPSCPGSSSARRSADADRQ